MSPVGDFKDMGHDHDLDDRTVERLLRGDATGQRDEHAQLAAALGVLRSQASAHSAPRPNEELLRIFAEGLGDDEPAAAAAPAPADPVASSAPGGRLRRAVRGPLARLAGLSLLVKVALGGAAVAAAAVGGAGVAGVLPGQDADARETDEPGAAEPAELPEEAEFGRQVADDATDGGVDGRVLSEERTRSGPQRPQHLMSEEPADRAEQQSGETSRSDDAPDADDRERGLDRAEERRADPPESRGADNRTEGEQRRSETPAGERGSQPPAEERRQEPPSQLRPVEPPATPDGGAGDVGTAPDRDARETPADDRADERRTTPDAPPSPQQAPSGEKTEEDGDDG
jgi:hypothetical protein